MKNRKPWFPIAFLFIILNAVILSTKNILVKNGFNQDVLIVGNLIVFFATILSFIIAWRSANATNPNASVRSLYGSFMVKFFIIITAAFIYIMVERKNLNKPSLFTSMGLYLVYTFLEVSVLTKQLKEKPNAAQRSSS